MRYSRKNTRVAGDKQAGKVCDIQAVCGGKRLTLKSFAKNASKPDGLRTSCRDCEAWYRGKRAKDGKETLLRYQITSGRLNGLKGARSGWEGRLKHFAETGEYVLRGSEMAEKRLHKDRTGVGRIGGWMQSWQKFPQRIDLMS